MYEKFANAFTAIILYAFLIFVFIGLPISLYLEQGVGYDPEIAIDNYSSSDVKIYLDNEFWMKVPVSRNLRTNSLDNETFSIDEGKHNIKIRSNSILLDEFSIDVEKRYSYVINILNACSYKKGRAEYHKEPRKAPKYEKNTSNSIIEVGSYDEGMVFMFSGPPESIKASRGSSGEVIKYIYRDKLNN